MLGKFNSILLVEDDEIDVMNVQRAFKKNSITANLAVAGNGLEALSMLRAEGSTKLMPFPSLILLDLNMPKMSGLEFLYELRKDSSLRQLMVVILTTSNDEKDIKTAYQYNVAGYIVKPVEFNLLVQSIKALDSFLSVCLLPQLAV